MNCGIKLLCSIVVYGAAFYIFFLRTKLELKRPTSKNWNTKKIVLKAAKLHCFDQLVKSSATFGDMSALSKASWSMTVIYLK